MKKERTKEVEIWLEPQSVRVSRIAAPLTSNQLGNEPQSTQVEKQDAPGGAASAGGAGSAGSADGAGGGYENLSNTGKLKNRARPFRNGFSFSRIEKASNWWSPKSADYQKGLSGSGDPRNLKFLRNWSMTPDNLFFSPRE